MNFRRILIAFLVAGASVVQPGMVAAAEEADELLKKGRDLRSAGKDREALSFFQRALEQQRTPRALAQVGLCEQALGLWVPAEAHIEEALGHGDNPWIQKNQTALRGALAFTQDKLGSIEVWGTPDGASVTVNGEPAGVLPMKRPVRTGEGRRIVKIEAPGFVGESRTVEVRARQVSREHVSLLATTAESSPSGGSTRGIPSALGSTPDDAVSPEGTRLARSEPAQSDDHDETPGLHQRWWFWALVGTAVVAGGVSAYLLTRPSDECNAPAGSRCW